jgi:hypothetical protein
MSQIVGGRDLHAYQEPPAVDPALLPAVNVMGQVTPAPQIEIADAEVGSHGNVEGFFKCWEEQMLYVIESLAFLLFIRTAPTRTTTVVN